MKKRTSRIYLALAALVFLLSGCEARHAYPQELVQIDSLTETRPDSAIALLRKINPQEEHMAEPDRMYYRLLKVKAADKAYITHTSDKEMLQILDYYKQQGDKRMLPLAYYYAGRTCHDLHKAPEALAYYHQAEN